MKGLTIVRPMTVTEGMLQTDVPEDDYPPWADDAPYPADARVIHGHFVWQSLQADNTGKQPDAEATWWVQVSPTNRWKAFDLSHTSQTAQNDAMYFEITPGTAVNAMALLNVDGVYSVRVRMTDPQFGLVYDKTVQLTSYPSWADWYTWYFGIRLTQDRAIFTDLPSYPDATLRLDFTGGAMAVGVILLGKKLVLGMGVAQGLNIGFRDYSRKTTNEWGDVELQKRAFAETQSLEFLLPNHQVRTVKGVLADLRATPTLWLASDKVDGLALYGWLSTFNTLIEYTHHSVCRLELEGLT